MKYYATIKIKQIVNIIVFATVLTLLLVFSKQNYSSVQNSVTLFFSSVLPSLFPFIFFTEFILHTNTIDNLSHYIGSFLSRLFHCDKRATPAIIIGFLCGFPMGAKTIAHLYEKGNISKAQATKLLLFINNCNPAFILSTIGISVFGNIKVGIILLISHYLSAILVGIAMGTKRFSFIILKNDKNLNTFVKTFQKEEKKDETSFFENVKQSMMHAFLSLTNIFGFIIIFNLIFNILQTLLQKLAVCPTFIAILSGIFEITNGSSTIYQSSMSLPLKIETVSFVLGLSGICILCQIYSTVSAHHFSFGKIAFAKTIQGIFSFGITYILLGIIPIQDSTLPIFSNRDTTITYSDFIHQISHYYIDSVLLIIAFLCIYQFISLMKQKK